MYPLASQFHPMASLTVPLKALSLCALPNLNITFSPNSQYEMCMEKKAIPIWLLEFFRAFHSKHLNDFKSHYSQSLWVGGEFYYLVLSSFLTFYSCYSKCALRTSNSDIIWELAESWPDSRPTASEPAFQQVLSTCMGITESHLYTTVHL